MPDRISSILSSSCAALLALGAALGACDSGPDRLSADEFAAQANAACEQARSDIEALDPVDVGDPATAAEAVDRTTEIQRTLRDRLAELVPPASGQSAYDDWIRQIDVVLEQSEHLAAALRAGDAAAQTEANSAGSEAIAAAGSFAVELGADECRDRDPTATGDPAAP